MSTDPTCPRVSNLLLLDSEGKRIAVKYFDENKYAQWSRDPPLTTRRPATCLPLQCWTLLLAAQVVGHSSGQL